MGVLRADGVAEDFDVKCQAIRNETGVSARSDFFDFLCLSRPNVPWDRLHALPSHDVS